MIKLWRRQRLGCIALVVAVGLCLMHSPPATAQDDSEDHGSRATRERSAKRATGLEFETDYRLGAFVGYYAQDRQLGGMVDAELSEAVSSGGHDVELELSYLFDSFSTKVFNFPEEDQVANNRRIVQPAHDLRAQLSWDAKWSKVLRSDLYIRGNLIYPRLERDEKQEVDAGFSFRIGPRRGLYARLQGLAVAKKYPNYLIADRRIDQREAEGTFELGYDVRGLGHAVVGFEYRYSDYIDARYQELLPDGTIIRSDRSKDYLRASPFVELTYRPSSHFRATWKNYVQLHDSRYYDRTMTGRDAGGALVEKFIPDYYDYTRYGTRLRVSTKPTDALALSALVDAWLRRFDTYEARNADNVWLGEDRQDLDVEVGVEASYLLDRLWGQEVRLVAFVSHLRRRSNMKREVAIATNFDITRAFAGCEVELD